MRNALGCFVLAVCATTISIARADCALDPSRHHLSHGDQTLAARNTFFLSVCGDGERQVIDLSDPTLKGRIGMLLHHSCLLILGDSEMAFSCG
jgi:hypothetical protein